MGDPFDYAAEAKLIQRFSGMWEKLVKMLISNMALNIPMLILSALVI